MCVCKIVCVKLFVCTFRVFIFFIFSSQLYVSFSCLSFVSLCLQFFVSCVCFVFVCEMFAKRVLLLFVDLGSFSFGGIFVVVVCVLVFVA